MKVGCIFCAYNAADMLRGSLQPWIDARKSRLGGHDYLIAAVSVPFKSFNEPRLDDTLSVLQFSLAGNAIDHLVLSEQPMAETEARGAALQWLVEAGAEVLLQVDADEFYLPAEIQRIFQFVQSRPEIVCFTGCLKNYVFDEKTYLVQPFTPMRIHRVRRGTYIAHSFWDDNNVLYRGTLTRDFKRDIDFPAAPIPKFIGWVKHLSWLSNERSRKKVAYQVARWGGSSFAWSEEKGLVWSPGHEQETAQD